MTAQLDLDYEDRNEAFIQEIAEKADLVRTNGQIGDLIRLRDARIRAGQQVVSTGASTMGQGAVLETPEDLVPPGPDGLPEIDVSDLTLEHVRSAMHHHGSLIVRNLMPARTAYEFRTDIDVAIDEGLAYYTAEKAGTLDERSTEAQAMFHSISKKTGLNAYAVKMFLGQSGSVGTFMSPRISHNLLDFYEGLGLRSILQAYFQDEPCLSFQKTVLRRAEPLTRPAEWHQDGAFMDEGIKSLNLWVSLTDCGKGTDSPGMDLVPVRLREIVKPGDNGAIFDWSVSDKTVQEKFKDAKPVRPFFGAGDAVFFDHFNLHATSSAPEFTQNRYAIETWFFAKSQCALNQNPVFW